MLFQEINFSEEFDGAWAAAALIHVPHNELNHVLTLIHQALKPNGVLLATFKHGDGQFTHEERTFYYMNEKSMRNYLGSQFTPIDIWTTDDRTSRVAPSPDKKWLNVLVRKS